MPLRPARPDDGPLPRVRRPVPTAGLSPTVLVMSRTPASPPAGGSPADRTPADRAPAGGAPAPDAHEDAGLGRTHHQLARYRRIGAVLLGIEALALLAAASFALWSLPGRPGVPANYGAGMALFLAIFAVLLGAAALSVARGTRFGVGYGITWQLFQALVGATMLRSGLVLVGIAAILAALAAFVVLMNLARYTPTPLERS